MRIVEENADIRKGRGGDVRLEKRPAGIMLEVQRMQFAFGRGTIGCPEVASDKNDSL